MRKLKYGGTIESPYDTLQDLEMDKAENAFEVANNPLTQFLDIIGGLTAEVGLSGALGTKKAKFGARVKGGEKLEVEGGEVAELPNGETVEFKGPDHEEGGIDIFLPNDTKVFSKRVAKFGETLAERKKNRDKELNKLTRRLKKNPANTELIDTIAKVQADNQKLEQSDMQLQEMIGMIEEGVGTKRAKFGTIVGKAKDYLASGLENMTPGDALALTGDLYSTFATLNNTKEARSKNRPNENFYENYGEESLKTIDESKDLIDDSRDALLENNAMKTAATRRSLGRTARGINTKRGLDLAADAQGRMRENEIETNANQQLLSLLGQEANIEANIDQVRMSGEEKRDIADRQDLAAYYTQRGEDRENIGRGLQETAKDLNQMRYNRVVGNLLDELSNYGIRVDSKGNVVGASGESGSMQNNNSENGYWEGITDDDIAWREKTGKYAEDPIDEARQYTEDEVLNQIDVRDDAFLEQYGHYLDFSRARFDHETGLYTFEGETFTKEEFEELKRKAQQ